MEKPNIVFLGTPRLAQITLEKLIGTDFQPSCIVTGPETKAGRGQNLQKTPVAQTALANNIPVTELKDIESDFDLAILVAFGKILPQKILDKSKHGFLNVHPSLLPKYRGPSPIQTAILEGEEKTGVSIMLLDKKVDHGPVLAQQEIELTSSDTHQSLIEKLGNLGADLLIKTVPGYLDGSVQPTPQDDSKATFTSHIEKQQGYIDPENPPSPEKVGKTIRAFYPWPSAWTKINGKMVKLLPENLVQPEGKRPMTIKEFLNGNPQAKPTLETILGSI